MNFLRGLLCGMLAGVFLVGCSSRELEKAAAAAGNVDLIRQCGELRRELDRIEPSLPRVSDEELGRLEEVNTIRTVVCTADLRAMTDAVRRLREQVE